MVAGRLDRLRAMYAIVQVVGGVAVLGSYALGLISHPGSGNELWGDIPPDVWIPYSLCMPPAAVGYLVLAWLLWTEPSEVSVTIKRTGWYLLFLGCSAAWMPLCFQLLDGGSPSLWWPIQGVLLGAALALLALGWDLFRLRGTMAPSRFRLAAVGWAFISWQCIILDALVWPRFFPGG